MSDMTLTVTLPETTYRWLKRTAELTYRSMDEVLAVTLNVGMNISPDLPPDLANELNAMISFTDEALWAATHPSLSPAAQSRLEQLSHKGGERALTSAETAEQAELLTAYDHSVLRRAQALAVLAFRGHPLSPERLQPVSTDDDDETTSPPPTAP